ncbi:hypothetical protein PFISCL1PPCAC_22640, partial [Pristionchus fissidentatus]
GTMPRTSASTSQPARRSGRHSGAANSFLSLDLYARGKIVTELEMNVKNVDANHNHNGVLQVDGSIASTMSVTPAKRRAQSVAPKSAAASTQKRKKAVATPEPEPDTESDESEEEEDSPKDAKRRGRKPAATTPAKARVAPAPKTPPSRVTRAKNQAPPSAKTAQQKLVKVKVETEDEEEEVAPAPKRTRGRSVAPAAARASAASAAAAAPKTKEPASLRALLDALVSEKHARLSAVHKKEMAATLEEVVAAAVGASSPLDAIHTLQQTVKQLSTGGRAPVVGELEADIAELEDANEMLEREKKGARAELEKREEEWAVEKGQLQQRVDELEEEMGEVKAARDTAVAAAAVQAAEAISARSSASSSSSATSASSNGSAASRSNNRLGVVPAQPIGPLLPAPAYHPGNLPRGSAVGHSTMSGRADELIHGVGNIAGMENTMASVAVTAATMPVHDENGDLVQRTVRTRVERIAVTDDMDLSQLRAMGFEVMPIDGDDSEEDDVEEVAQPAAARIRELSEDDDDDEEEHEGRRDETDHEEDDGAEDGPLVEEAE